MLGGVKYIIQLKLVQNEHLRKTWEGWQPLPVRRAAADFVNARKLLMPMTFARRSDGLRQQGAGRAQRG